jgi:hypothetical protein
LGRPLTDAEKQRVGKVVGAWKDDLTVLARERDQGKVDQLAFHEQAGDRTRDLTRQFQSLLHANRQQSADLVGVFASQLGVVVPGAGPSH